MKKPIEKLKRFCPICRVGRSEHPTCFHCDTCGFMGCRNMKKEMIEMFKKRIKDYYKI